MKNIVSILLIIATVGVGEMVQAQQLAKVLRIGFLGASSLSAVSARIEAFRQGLPGLAT